MKCLMVDVWVLFEGEESVSCFTKEQAPECTKIMMSDVTAKRIFLVN
jgi:hypothetical protein